MSSPGAESADAVVIGAGHNGLVAANLLADAGWDVLVLEAHGDAGRRGALRPRSPPPATSATSTARSTRSAYASPVLRGLRARPSTGCAGGTRPDVLAHLLPDGRAAVLNRDPDGHRGLAGAVRRRATASAGCDAYDDWRASAEPMLDALLTPFPPVRGGPRPAAPAAASPARCGWPARLRAAGAPARRRNSSTGEGAPAAAGRLRPAHRPVPGGRRLAACTAGCWPCSASRSAGRCRTAAPQQITDALVARLTGRGGRIRLRRPGRPGAGRPRPGDGRAHRRRRAVAGPAGGARRRAGAGALPGPGRRGGTCRPGWWRTWRASAGTARRVKVDWALSGAGAVDQPRRSPAPARCTSARDLDGLTRYAADAAPAGAARATRSCWSARWRRPTRAARRPGTESLWAYTHLPFRRQLAGRRRSPRTSSGWRTVLEEARARASASLIAGRHVAGPADLEAGDPSLVGGALGGGTAAAYQQLFLRPIPGLGRADTPVDRLFLASASAHPGGGVHGAPGANAARAALARDRALTGAPTPRRSPPPTAPSTADQPPTRHHLPARPDRRARRQLAGRSRGAVT